MAEAKKQFFIGDIYGVMLIPQEFSKKILHGEQAKIVVYADASYFLFYRQVLTGILHSTATMSAGVEIQRMLAKGFTMEQAMAYTPDFKPGARRFDHGGANNVLSQPVTNAARQSPAQRTGPIAQDSSLVESVTAALAA